MQKYAFFQSIATSVFDDEASQRPIPTIEGLWCEYNAKHTCTYIISKLNHKLIWHQGKLYEKIVVSIGEESQGTLDGPVLSISISTNIIKIDFWSSDYPVYDLVANNSTSSFRGFCDKNIISHYQYVLIRIVFFIPSVHITRLGSIISNVKEKFKCWTPHSPPVGSENLERTTFERKNQAQTHLKYNKIWDFIFVGNVLFIR